ncbi:MAG TPA: HEAT repeat domain-containing protein [Phycisphaerales bacterium]|nr:HEAT repeat domain-containing protein [Phycisphaerales bacterium]
MLNCILTVIVGAALGLAWHLARSLPGHGGHVVQIESHPSYASISACIPCESKFQYATSAGWVASDMAVQLTIDLRGLAIQSSWSDQDIQFIGDIWRGTSPMLDALDERSTRMLRILAIKVTGRFLGPRGGLLTPADRAAWRIVESALRSPDPAIRLAACQATEFAMGRSQGLAEGLMQTLRDDRDEHVRNWAASALTMGEVYGI